MSYSHGFDRWITLLFVTTISLIPAASEASARFEEGDWLAYGDTRDFYDFSVGRNTLYIGTDNGILRYDRHEKHWLTPWFSVPGSLENSIILTQVRRVREDPLTGDVYAHLQRGWVKRSIATERWEYIDQPDPDVFERTRQGSANDARPDSHVITPYLYTLGQDNSLTYRFTSWEFAGGAEDEWGSALFGWTGFGVGVLNRYSPHLDLFPGGPGPSTALAITDTAIWCASTLDRDRGWVWQRNRNGDRWTFFQPDAEWGLEPADVNAIDVGTDGTVWLATTDGVMYRRNGQWRHIRRQEGLPRFEMFDVVGFRSGAWVATLSGLAFIDGSSGIVLRPDRENDRIPFSGMFYQLAADGDTLYAAGGSILMTRVGEGPFEEIEVPGAVAAGTVPTALYAENGILAIGTPTGFTWRTPDGNWHQALARQWWDGAVLDIDYHGGYFWLATDRGLVKYDPVERDAIRYTREDGLVGTKVFRVIGEGDWLWIGTDVALVRFYWNAPGRLD